MSTHPIQAGRYVILEADEHAPTHITDLIRAAGTAPVTVQLVRGEGSLYLVSSPGLDHRNVGPHRLAYLSGR